MYQQNSCCSTSTVFILLLVVFACNNIANGESLTPTAVNPVSVSKIELPYTNSWAVEIQGGLQVANDIAKKHGMTNLGQIGSLENMYHFLHDVNKDGKMRGMYSNELHLHTRALQSESLVGYVQQQTLQYWQKKYIQVTSDPIWQYQWSVNNTGQTGEPNIFLDLKAEQAWIQGYTGKGIIVSVVDDGVQHSHNDLTNNYNSEYSYDFNDDDANPTPNPGDSHGTACAGQIAMTRNNSVCGVGVAYDAKVAGIRILGGGTTDAIDAMGISYRSNNVHIYSNSWGPPDNGYTLGRNQSLTLMAFRQGAMNGRGGRGNIFTWAAGNGGTNYDACSADIFVQSIYSIPVGAYSQNGFPASYDEKCASKLTVAYVDNTRNSSLGVGTLGLNDRCVLDFGGTSSSTPYVSAIIALTLEANPSLTWRDVQYLIVYTSNPTPLLQGTDDEFTNGAGLVVSHQFGFGAIDAEAMVTRAQHWINVPAQVTDTATPGDTSGMSQTSQPLQTSFTYSGNIVYLEHIVVTLSITPMGFNETISPSEAETIVDNDAQNDNLYFDRYENRAKRGDIYVTLRSPNNTVSTILFTRPFDITTDGYIDWPCLSTLHWGENPSGKWTITIGWNNTIIGSAMLHNISVNLYGVSTIPTAVSRIPNTCHSTCASKCAAAGPQYCDACASPLLRNATTRECIQPSQCNDFIASGYCYTESVDAVTPTSSVTPTSGATWSVMMINKFILVVVLMIAIKLF